MKHKRAHNGLNDTPSSKNPSLNHRNDLKDLMLRNKICMHEWVKHVIMIKHVFCANLAEIWSKQD